MNDAPLIFYAVKDWLMIICGAMRVIPQPPDNFLRLLNFNYFFEA